MRSTKADPRNELLIEQIYNYFIRRFMEQSLMSGAMIDKKAVADELEVSVEPVGRALARLSSEGFVKILPQKGTFVATVRIEFVVDSLVMRLAIECQAARIYCGAPVKENLDRLLPLARSLDQHTLNSSKYWVRDNELHSALIALTGSESLIGAFGRITQLGLFGLLNCFFERPASENHENLVLGLMDPNPNKAERLIREHLHSGKPNVINEAVVGSKKWTAI